MQSIHKRHVDGSFQSCYSLSSSPVPNVPQRGRSGHLHQVRRCDSRLYLTSDTGVLPSRSYHLSTVLHRRNQHLPHCNATASIVPNDSTPEPPTSWWPYQRQLLQKMAGFMGPALLIPMGDPLMSLVDSVTIGQFAGTADLAALGPANMVFSFSTYIFQCLQVATLSLVASHIREGDNTRASNTLGTALTLALLAGLLSTGLLAGFNEKLIVASGVKDVSLVAPAANYLQIRSFAQPAVLLTLVAQSGMLAQQDSLTPCLSVLLTVVCSLLANIVFVAVLGWGLTGAAATTVMTQYVGVAALLWALHRPGEGKIVPCWWPSDKSPLQSLLRTMAPLTIVSMSKNTCYLVVQLTAATLSTLCLAAHQACFSLWGVFTWTISPVEQACLAYLPAAKAQWEKQATSQLIVVLGTLVAAVGTSGLWGVMVGAPGLLVKDAAVQPFVSQIAPQAMATLVVTGIDVAATAINISMKDFQYVARSYVLTFMATGAYFAACRHYSWGLSGVWWGLFTFFTARAIQSTARAAWLLKLWPGQQQQEDTTTANSPQHADGTQVHHDSDDTSNGALLKTESEAPRSTSNQPHGRESRPLPEQSCTTQPGTHATSCDHLTAGDGLSHQTDGNATPMASLNTQGSEFTFGSSGSSSPVSTSGVQIQDSGIQPGTRIGTCVIGNQSSLIAPSRQISSHLLPAALANESTGVQVAGAWRCPKNGRLHGFGRVQTAHASSFSNITYRQSACWFDRTVNSGECRPGYTVGQGAGSDSFFRTTNNTHAAPCDCECAMPWKCASCSSRCANSRQMTLPWAHGQPHTLVVRTDACTCPSITYHPMSLDQMCT